MNVIVRSEACPKDRDDFCEAVEEAIRPHEKNKYMLMVIRDFIPKTGSRYSQCKDEQGNMAKGSKTAIVILYFNSQKKETDLEKYSVRPKTSTSNNMDS